MTYTNNQIEGLQNVLSKEYDKKLFLSFNDIISYYSKGFSSQSKKEIAQSILLIYNIDYREHSLFIENLSFYKKKTIIQLLQDFNIIDDTIENRWKEFLEVVEMETLIYRSNIKN